jgi:hypothetical protein
MNWHLVQLIFEAVLLIKTIKLCLNREINEWIPLILGYILFVLNKNKNFIINYY